MLAAESRQRFWLHLALAIAGITALVLLLLEIGFPLSPPTQQRVLLATTGALWLGIAAELAALILNPRPRHQWRQYASRRLPILALATALLLKDAALPLLQERFPGFSETNLEALYLGLLQVVLLVRLAIRSLRFNQLLLFARIPPGMLLAGSFLALIALGTALLKLPRATTDGNALGWLDALFTSASAVCVTGLIVVDTATVFTDFGKLILLVLFQLGGLGLMTFAYFFVSVFAKVTIKDRTLLLDFLNEDDVGRITGTLVAIILLTVVCESIGAGLLHTAILSTDPARADWLDSIFHSVSAFCNAGFSTYTAGLADAVTSRNPTYQIVIMGLIVLGGLGFPVLKNLWEHTWSRRRRNLGRRQRLTTHTKTVLITTTALLLGGWLLIYLFEFARADHAGESTSAFTALFWAVTARTAGFNTAAVDLLTPATVLVIMVLMFIGGAPAGTAGGIKVTTFAVATLNTLRILRRPGEDLVAFGRSIPPDVANRAFALSLLALGWVGGSTIILNLLMPGHPPLDLAFEAISAFATVGLSRGLTAELPALGKGLIILSMIVGRIGILYAALSLVGRHHRGRVRYPSANIIIA